MTPEAEMTTRKDPLDIVWAVTDGNPLAGQMTRAMLSTSEGWKEVDESHPKVKATLEQPGAYITDHNTEPDRATTKEK
jgi:hypothetical protein